MASTEADRSSPATARIAAHTAAFRRRFLMTATALGLTGLVVVVGLALTMPRLRFMLAPVVASAAALAACHLWARRGQLELSANVFVVVALVVVTFISAVQALPTSISGSIVGYTFVGCIAAFLLSTGRLVAFVVASWGGIAIVTLRTLDRGILTPDLAWAAAASGGALFAGAVGTLSVFAGHHRAGLKLLQTQVDDIDRVMDSAKRIADGDLATAVRGDNEVSETVRRMLHALRDVVLEIRQQVHELTEATSDIAELARAQRSGAESQARQVDAASRALDELRATSQDVAASAESVYGAIRDTEVSNQASAERLDTLAGLAQQIGNIAELIRGVASKSEILALNAALEGTAAGEHGRGFSLVANRMQDLAEQVMASVKDVKLLAQDIDAATVATVAATREGTARATSATAASQGIRRAAQRQHEDAKIASDAMRDVARGAAEVSHKSERTLRATERLEALAQALDDLVDRFTLETDAPSSDAPSSDAPSSDAPSSDA